MAKGRKPKPTVIKKLTGNPGGRTLNKNEPTFSKNNIIPPEHLDSTALGEWNRLAPEMIKIGLLTAGDVAGFAAYCSAYSRWIRAETRLNLLFEAPIINNDGDEIDTMVFKTHRGNLSINPLIRVANASMELMLKAAAEFGLTPSSRSRAGRNITSGGDADRDDPSAGNF